MANVINRTTYQYLTSVNTPDYVAADWLHNPDLSSVINVPRQYWKVVGDAVVEATSAEKVIIDGPKYETGQSVKAEGQTDTSSAEYQDRLSLTTDYLRIDKTYHLCWYCEVKNKKRGGGVQFEISVNGMVIAEPLNISKQWMSDSGIKELVNMSGNVTIALRFKKHNTGTASIRRARLLILSDN